MVRIDNPTRVSHESEVHRARIIPLHIEVVVVVGPQNRDAIITFICEANVASCSRGNGYLEGGSDGAAKGVGRVLRYSHIAYRAICRKARVVALEAVVAEYLAVDAAVT